MEENIIITDKERFEAIKESIIADGPETLQVVSDFDKTLTSFIVNGKKVATLISLLRDEHYLTPDYSEKAQALYDKYHPIEINPNISLEEKKTAMHEWWSKHYDLLIESGLSKSDLRNVVNSYKTAFRHGALDFFDILYKQKIPLLIFSSAGLGAETISLYLERFDKLTENIRIVSNSFIWNNDKVIGVAEPIIHVFNKDFTAVKQCHFYKEIENRKNVVLLGDGLSDARMLDGFDHKNVIKIGFLNDPSEGRVEDYTNVYDVVILNDGPIDYVNQLLNEIAK